MTSLDAATARLKAFQTEIRSGCMVCQSHDHLKRCGSCQCVFYCSPEHQVQHWKTHKLQCAELKESRARIEVDGEMDEVKCRQLLQEVARIANSMSSPKLSRDEILAKAIRAKELCEVVARWPGHVNLGAHTRLTIMQSFVDYADKFVIAKLGTFPDACRETVQKMRVRWREYKLVLPLVSGVPVDDVQLVGMLAKIEAWVGNHAEAVVHFRECIPLWKDQIATGSNSPDTMVALMRYQGDMYHRLMISAWHVSQFKLMDASYLSACDSIPPKSPALLKLRVDYLRGMSGRIHAIFNSTGTRDAFPGVTADFTLALGLAMQEAKEQDDFVSWSKAAKTGLGWEMMVDHDCERRESLLAHLVLRLHPCWSKNRVEWCSDVRMAKQIVSAPHHFDRTCDEFLGIEDACDSPCEKEWDSYRACRQ
ncbi:hypothetical protein HDU98_009879 [Podochytrium sp. JEL0797]|nr:hypothetical protein HDU98_009879 [Podochytrium sp. JEL0797]